MRKIIYIFLFVALGGYSCSDMNDNISVYYDKGEINYIAAVDSVSVIPGKNRAQFTWKVYPDPKIESCRFYWNDRGDSATVVIDKDQITEDRYYTAIIDNLPEGSYVYQMHHIGSIGHPSVPYNQDVRIYGEFFESNLIPRTLISMELDAENQVVLNWAAVEGFMRVELKYWNIEGVNKVIDIPQTEMTTVISDFIPGETFSYETFVKPSEKEFLDEFAAPVVIDNFPDIDEGDEAVNPEG